MRHRMYLSSPRWWAASSTSDMKGPPIGGAPGHPEVVRLQYHP